MTIKRAITALKKGKTVEEALKKTKDSTYYELLAEKERIEAEKAAKNKS